MRLPFTPTNIDDAFVQGWNQGRGLTGEDFMAPVSGTPLHIAREFERGVAEGMAFEGALGSACCIVKGRAASIEGYGI
jgi:hypothetical protein